MTSMEILQKEGFNVIPVPEQMSADGQFPNVTKTPNPEIPECLDRAEVVAKAHNAHLLLATDPDADRLGAMIPDDQGAGVMSTGTKSLPFQPALNSRCLP